MDTNKLKGFPKEWASADRVECKECGKVLFNRHMESLPEDTVYWVESCEGHKEYS